MSNPKFISKSGLTKNDICNYMLSEIESYNRPQHKTTIHHSKHYDDDINDYRKYMDTSSDLDELDELDEVLLTPLVRRYAEKNGETLSDAEASAGGGKRFCPFLPYRLPHPVRPGTECLQAAGHKRLRHAGAGRTGPRAAEPRKHMGGVCPLPQGICLALCH